MTEKLRIALLASGSGSNLEAVTRGCLDGRVAARPVVALANNPSAYALERARMLDLPTLVADHREHKSRKAHEEHIIELLEPYGPQLLVLAGYMRVVTSTLIDHFAGLWRPRLPGIMNIHPADTRQYQGAHGYEFAMGLLEEAPTRLRETAITVHFVDAGVDTGPIIAQRVVPIHENDTLDDLRERGLKVEHQLYPECVDLYARGELTVETGKVLVYGDPVPKRPTMDALRRIERSFD
jgi:phosphoribosylglycinamide formyltransferase-1